MIAIGNLIASISELESLTAENNELISIFVTRASCKTMFEVNFERKLRSCGYYGSRKK